MTKPDHVDAASIDWAMAHIQKYGDTDVFPLPFECEAMACDWPAIRTHLEHIDFGDHKVRAHKSFAVPKSSSGFRIGHQLDPLDAILYAAVVREMAESIEVARVSRKQRVACSYRIEVSPEGSFFAGDRGWTDFHEVSAKHAATAEFVLTADIADFYNQIYQHRLKNALEDAEVSEDRAANTELFLSQIGAKQSQGLPVGPHASIVLAEACLIDVDTMLMRGGYKHARFVDDFRLFGSTRNDCVVALHDLTKYLYTAHRLSLQGAKTRIQPSKKFIERELEDPEKEEEDAKVKALQDLIEQLRENSGYDVELDDLNDDDVNAATREALSGLFDEVAAEAGLRLGIARYILRRAKALRTRILYPTVLENLEKLVPALRDVCEYLVHTMPSKKEHNKPVGEALLSLANDSSFAGIPFVRMWVLDVIAKKPSIVDMAKAMDLAEKSAASLGVRPAALIAKAYKLRDWVRSQKETWRSHGPWDRRAVIWAGSVLPRDERHKWLDNVRDGAEPLERAVAIAARS